MPQLAQCLGFNLPDALPGNRENLADFLERVLAAVIEAESHADDALLAWSQGPEDRRNLVLQVKVDRRVGRGEDSLVLDEVAQVRLALIAQQRLKLHIQLPGFLPLPHRVHWHTH